MAPRPAVRPTVALLSFFCFVISALAFAACGGGGGSPSPTATRPAASPTASDQPKLTADRAPITGPLLMNVALVTGDGANINVQIGRAGEARVEFNRPSDLRSQNCTLSALQLFKDANAAGDRLASVNAQISAASASAIAAAYGGVVLLPNTVRVLIRGFGTADLTDADRGTLERLLVLVATACKPPA